MKYEIENILFFKNKHVVDIYIALYPIQSMKTYSYILFFRKKIFARDIISNKIMVNAEILSDRLRQPCEVNISHASTIHSVEKLPL